MFPNEAVRNNYFFFRGGQGGRITREIVIGLNKT